MDPKHELDLVIDEGRRFAAFNPPKDLKARLQLLPDEVLRARGIVERLKLTADKDEAEAKLREAREQKRSDSMWPEVGWLGAHHPVFDWLVDKLLVRFGRNEAPVLQAKVRTPTYLVQIMFHERITRGFASRRPTKPGSMYGLAGLQRTGFVTPIAK